MGTVIPLKLKRMIKGGYLTWREFGPAMAMAHVRAVRTGDDRNRYEVLLAWLEREYAPILERYRDCRETAIPAENPPIWTMWWDGRMPEVIELCHRSKLRHAGDHPVILLTRQNIREYVDFPETVWERFESGQLRIQHLADMIRVRLLRKYGGLWLDASVFCAGSIPEECFSGALWSVRGVPDGQYVSENRWTSFALGGWRGNGLCSFLDEFFRDYVRRGKPFADYYLLDCAIALAYRNIPAVREGLESLDMEEKDIYRLDRQMQEPAALMDLPVFSKLSWRRLVCPVPGSMYDALLARYGMKNGAVSVIVPVYNVEAYLPKCLDSLLMQSYVNWQAILVDDGSTDSSGAICDAYARRDSRFRVIRQPNAGAGAARNRGLDLADGEYIAFLDSDDWVEPEWLQTLMNAGADVAECGFTEEFADGPRAMTPWAEERFPAEEYLARYPGEWRSALVWNKLYRAALLRTVWFPEGRRIDDEFFTYRAVAGAGEILRLPKALYHYRQRKSGAVSNPENQRQKTADALELLTERYRWICENFPALAPHYRRQAVENLFYLAGAMEFTAETAALFRRTARFYLGESRKELSLLPAAVRLLMISEKDLLAPKQRPDLGAYYP